MEIDHVTWNHSAHHPGHRAARRLQRARWRPLLWDGVLWRRWPWPGARHRADLGFARADLNRRQIDLDGGALTESWPSIHSAGPGSRETALGSVRGALERQGQTGLRPVRWEQI